MTRKVVLPAQDFWEHSTEGKRSLLSSVHLFLLLFHGRMWQD